MQITSRTGVDSNLALDYRARQATWERGVPGDAGVEFYHLGDTMVASLRPVHPCLDNHIVSVINRSGKLKLQWH